LTNLFEVTFKTHCRPSVITMSYSMKMPPFYRSTSSTVSSRIILSTWCWEIPCFLCLSVSSFVTFYNFFWTGLERNFFQLASFNSSTEKPLSYATFLILLKVSWVHSFDSISSCRLKYHNFFDIS
jgi:hypothetical protein